MRPDRLLTAGRAEHGPGAAGSAPGGPRRSVALGAAALLLLAACKGGEPTSVSTKQRVVAKSGAVWGRDLANGLGLQEWELCSELGRYDCISDAHRITLGGVEPEVLGIDEPLPNATVSAPIAVDRVAASACAARWTRDQAGPAVIFGPVLKEDSKAAREQVAGTLVTRLYGREATRAELQSLLDLEAAIAPVTTQPLRDWAVGACVVVATSTEALFY